MNFEKITKDVGKYYLYQHIRFDTNEPFYIGVGTKYNHKNDYTRAKVKGSQRNNIWRGIVSRTDYKIEIIMENDEYSIIKNKEIELIKKHGQIIKNTGVLCNLTDGGDGTFGHINKNIWKPVFIYSKDGFFLQEFKSVVDCAKFLKCSKNTISFSYDKKHLIKGYIIKSFKIEKVEPILDIREKLKKRLSKKIYQFDLNGNFIMVWDSSSEAARQLNISGGHIREMANGSNKRKQVGGFIWKYKIK